MRRDETSPDTLPPPAPIAERFARGALAAAFLSAVAGRFGLWTGAPAGEAFRRFVGYTGQVLAFLPQALIVPLAGAATAAETLLALALLTGFRLHRTALASAALLGAFGIAMAISFGPKEPLDYSVFSAAGAAWLLADRAARDRERRP